MMKTCLEYMGLNIYKFLISQNISADLQGSKEKYKPHYGRCTGLLFRAATQHMDMEYFKFSASTFGHSVYSDVCGFVVLSFKVCAKRTEIFQTNLRV